MITGDKLETAKNIAKSCHLFRYGSKVITINGEDKQSVKRQLSKARKKIDVKDGKGKCLVIKGKSLIYALSIYKEMFLVQR